MNVFSSHQETIQRDTCRPQTLVYCLAHTNIKQSSSECVREALELRGHHYHAPPSLTLSAAPLKWAPQGRALNYFYREALILHRSCHWSRPQISPYLHILLKYAKLILCAYRCLLAHLLYLLCSINSYFQLFFKNSA